MDLSMYRAMDPAILASIINMRIRNSGTDLQTVLDDLDIEVEAFIGHMAKHGYHYSKARDQFRNE